MENKQKSKYSFGVDLAPLLKDIERTTEAIREATRPFVDALANFQMAVNVDHFAESVAALTDALNTDALRGLERLQGSLGFEAGNLEDLAATLSEQLVGRSAMQLTPVSTRQTQTVTLPALTVHGELSSLDDLRSARDLFATVAAVLSILISVSFGIIQDRQLAAHHEDVVEGINDLAASDTLQAQKIEELQDSLEAVMEFHRLINERIQRLAGDAASE